MQVVQQQSSRRFGTVREAIAALIAYHMKRDRPDYAEETQNAFDLNMPKAYLDIELRNLSVDQMKQCVHAPVSRIEEKKAAGMKVRKDATGLRSSQLILVYFMALFREARNYDRDAANVNSGVKFQVNDITPYKDIKPPQPKTRKNKQVIDIKAFRHLWHDLGDVGDVGLASVFYIRLLLIIGGQRPVQVARCKWCDFDKDKSTLRIINRKKGNHVHIEEEDQEHVIFLTAPAVDLLNSMAQLLRKKSHEYIFHSNSKHRHFSKTTAGQIISLFKKWMLKNGHACNQDFTARNLRTLCRTFMCEDEDFGGAGLSDKQGDYIQDHATGSVGDDRYNANEAYRRTLKPLTKWAEWMQREIIDKPPE